MHRLHVLALASIVCACGSGTAAETEILDADLETQDVPADARAALTGESETRHRVQFPDGGGTVWVEVVHGSAGATRYMRAIRVRVIDAAGYELGASLIGNPTNAGTPADPVHTRIVQLRRTRSGLGGTSSSTMSVRVSPSEVTPL